MPSDAIKAELGSFKGVGPKTISCVLMFALQRPEFPVDTHVWEISKKLVCGSHQRHDSFIHNFGHVHRAGCQSPALVSSATSISTRGYRRTSDTICTSCWSLTASNASDVLRMADFQVAPLIPGRGSKQAVHVLLGVTDLKVEQASATERYSRAMSLVSTRPLLSCCEHIFVESFDCRSCATPRT
jgi:hypothetical protein